MGYNNMLRAMQAVMAVAVVAAVAHSLPHASVDAIVPEPDFYETDAIVKAEHLPALAAFPTTDFPEAMRAIDNDHKEAVETALLATGSGSMAIETALLATGSGMAQETELLAA